MDYLRRLYPRHADTPGAALLDLAPAFGMRSPAADPPMFSTVPQAAGGTTIDTPAWPRLLPHRPETPASSSRPPADAVPAPMPLPIPSQQKPSAADRGAPRELRSAPLPAPPLLGQQTPAAHPRITEAAIAPPAAMPLRATAVPARTPQVQPEPLAPLRISTVLQAGAAERQRTAEPAPVVHVTIDRIDVRLPSAPAAATPPPRRRPASAVGSLGDYLRGRPSEVNT